MVFYWRPLCIDGVGVNPKTRSLAKRKGAGSISGCPSHWTFTYCFFSERNFRLVCFLNSLMFKVPQPDFCLFLSTYNCLISLCFLCSPGHFTQVVWKSSSKLGVGIARKNGHILVVANYDPPGNYQGQYANNVRRSWRFVLPAEGTSSRWNTEATSSVFDIRMGYHLENRVLLGL